MNALDNIERTLEEWGQNLRGGTSAHGLQPRDVLHAVLASLEHNRVEGLDHKMYAPNAYTVELHLDEEERARLLPFIGNEDLEAAIERYCGEHKYQFRGPLSLQVVDAGPSPVYPPEGETPRPAESAQTYAARKVVVQSRFDVSQAQSRSWDPELARQFVTPDGTSYPASEHDLQRRDVPTYAGSSDPALRR
jgi:hypothetical protein